MAFVMIYTFAAVIGLARKVTRIIIPAEAFDYNWSFPALLAVGDVGDYKRSVSGATSAPETATETAHVAFGTMHDSAAVSGLDLKEPAASAADLDVEMGHTARKPAVVQHELALCQQDLETAREQLAAERSKAADAAAVWEAMVIRLQGQLETQVLARENAENQVYYAEVEMDKAQRQLKRSAMAAAVHIHTIEHEVVYSRAAIGVLTTKLASTETEKNTIQHEWHHARHLLSGAYDAQREAAAKIVAMEDQAAQQAAKLKAAEYETNKLSIYLEMANKMGDMQLAQAHAGFAAERRSLITTLAAVALDRVRTSRRLAITRDMADAFRVEAQDARLIIDKLSMELSLQDSVRLTMRIKEIETPLSARATEMAASGQCDFALTAVAVSVQRQDSAVGEAAVDIGMQIEQHEAGKQDHETLDARQAKQIEPVKEAEEGVQAVLALIDNRHDEAKIAALGREIDLQQDCGEKDACRATEERLQEVVCEFGAIQEQLSEPLATLDNVRQQRRGTAGPSQGAEHKQPLSAGDSAIGLVESAATLSETGASEQEPRLEADAELRAAQVFADLDRQLFAHLGVRPSRPAVPTSAAGAASVRANLPSTGSEPQDYDSQVTDRDRSRLEAETLAILAKEQAHQLQELGRVCEQQREHIQEQQESAAMLDEQLRWLWDAVRWGGVPVAHVRRDSC